MERTIYKKDTYVCSCGRIHHMPIEEMIVGSGALEELSKAPKRLHLGRNVLLVIDEAIMNIMGGQFIEQLERASCQVETLVYRLPTLPDEKHLFEFLRAYTQDIDFFVAAGTGTVNDITRYFSSKLKKPYISIPTAPSMDGYSAKVSLLFVEGVKQTLDSIYPTAIYADTSYLKNAPNILLAAGVGDLAAKITACADWKISGFINGEYYCQQTIDRVMESVKKCMGAAPGLVERDEEAVQVLMDGLLLSGIAMHWVESSRPAAGAEHHITHFWGMKSGAPQHLHGIEVAIGTLIMLRAYRCILEYDFSEIKIDERVAAALPEEEWKKAVSEIYGEQASVIFEQQKDKTFDKEQIRERLERIILHEQEIKNVIQEILVYEEPLEKTLRTLKAPVSAEELGISKNDLTQSFLWAKEIRSKYVVLDLAYDLGILEEIAEKIF